ncbi:MAG TPA: hypothetical protein DIC64_03190 [Alphaproteobacteria bacterium]|nr:hypothetical protein [Alphaproteobacteria bacterium]
MKNKETGRSMVEMLGVLAIIGVLSAGALAGYSKAMFRHKVNQTIEIFQGALQRLAELEQTGWGKDKSIDVNNAVQYGFLKECKKASISGWPEVCQLPIGNFYMWFYDNGAYVYGQFHVFFTDSKSCVAFSSAPWKEAIPTEWWYYPENSDSGGYWSISNQTNGGESIYDPVEGKTEVTMENIITGCQGCSSNEPCDFYLVVRLD